MPDAPFKVPDSIRPLDPTMPLGRADQFTDPPTGNPVTVTNAMTTSAGSTSGTATSWATKRTT